MHTYIHTYIHTHIYTYIHTYTHIYIHTYTHIHTYIETYIRTYIHASLQAAMHATQVERFNPMPSIPASWPVIFAFKSRSTAQTGFSVLFPCRTVGKWCPCLRLVAGFIYYRYRVSFSWPDPDLRQNSSSCLLLSFWGLPSVKRTLLTAPYACCSNNALNVPPLLLYAFMAQLFGTDTRLKLPWLCVLFFGFLL